MPTPPVRRRTSPVTPQSLNTTATALIAIGLVVIFMAWFGAASVDRSPAQMPYLISGGLTGLLFAIAGFNLLRVHEARKDTQRIIDKLDEVLGGARAPAHHQPGDATVGADDLVIVGNERFHRPDCRVVAAHGSPADAVPAQVAHARGLAPCRVCRPVPEAVG